MTDPTRISLVLSDVDGTLVTEDKVLTDRAKRAVSGLRERNIRFAITSGRPPLGMAMLIEPLQIDTPIAGFNGGVFVRPDLSVIETRALTPDAARKAIEIIEGYGMDAWLYTSTDWLVRKKDAPHVARESWTVKFDPKIVAQFGDTDLEHAVKIVGVSDDVALMARCEADVNGALDGKASSKRSQPYYLDVTNPQATKAAVVDMLSRTLNIPVSEIATIGDMPNDVSMFRRSGFGIAMGNASDDVKSQASAVTDSYNNEGFAKAIERYVLRGDLP